MLLLLIAMSSLVHVASTASLPLDCEDVYDLKISINQNASVPSGVYTIYPAGLNKPVKVFCDMGCMGNDSHIDGKWTVIQRRSNGNLSFYRPWEHYKAGFGNANGEYWIGLQNLFLMTFREKYQLRVDMEDFDNGNVYAQYSVFQIDPESSNYKLNIGGYTNGGAGDSLSYVNGMSFATFDKDSTGGCAEGSGGGFWYYSYWGWYYGSSSCAPANPNGQYKYGTMAIPYTGIRWQSWKGDYYSLKTITMKLKRMDLQDLENLANV